MKKYCFGIDIGGTTVKCGLFNVDGEVLDKWEIKTNTENNGASILDDIVASLEGKMADAGISKDDVEGVGIGVPGPVKNDSIVCQCVNLGWGTFDVAETLSGKIGLPVKVGNDANVAALGEMWKGGGQGCKNGVMVTLGTGVGGGIIVDGKIVTGAHGAGGEIGHITVRDDETEACGCGRKGCLEQYASATGLVRLAKRYFEKNTKNSILTGKEITAKEVFDAAKAGDAIAIGLVDEVCEILGSTLSNIACVVNPEIIVIGGGVSKAGDILLDNIKKHFVETSFMACRETKFALAGLGNDAGMYGCVEMLLD